MTKSNYFSQQSLSRVQMGLFGMIILLTIGLEGVIFRAYVNIAGTIGVYEQTGRVTADLANAQREALRLRLETVQALSKPALDLQPLIQRRALLTRQLTVVEIGTADRPQVVSDLSEIQSTLVQFDQVFAGLRTNPTPEQAAAVAPQLDGILSHLERQMATLYDREEVLFFKHLRAALNAQRTSQMLLLGTSGLVLLFSVVLTLSLRNSVRTDFERAYRLLQAEMAERKQAEEALRESEERYALAARGANDGLWDWDLKTNEVYFSSRWKAMLGYEKDGIGNSPNEWLERVHPDCRERVKAEISAHLEGHTRQLETEHRMLHKDGSYRWMLSRGLAVRDANGVAYRMAGSQSDITKRKEAEEQINASLREKEVLLKEIHHRVKNNLQVISSLLNLQSGSIQDPVALDVLRESQNRVRSMALIHEQLYRSPDLARIDFAEYVHSLTDYLVRSSGASRANIDLKVNINDVLLDIDTVMPCGLIVNELVSNALKHAFPAGREGVISIDFRPVQDNQFALRVSDNGIGFPKNLDFRNVESLGLQLVTTLVDQLEGTIELYNGDGTAFEITLPHGA